MKQNIRTNTQKPLRQLAKELIVEMIQKDGFREHEKLPPERELAARFGISRATVARAYTELTEQGVLYHRVGQGTFVLNDGAVTGKKPYRIVALFLPNIINPVFALFCSEFENEAFKYGYNVILCQSEKGLKKIRDTYVRRFEENAVDAIAVVAGSVDVLELIQATKIPHVFIAAQPKESVAMLSNVLPVQTEVAVSMATEHLLALGHRKIALIGGNAEMNQDVNLAGYTAVMKKHDLPLCEQFLIFEDKMPEYDSMGLALDYRLIGEWLLDQLLVLKEPPTAAVVYNDARAIGMIEAARKKGIRIPEDLALVGIDNNSEGASPAVSLSSVDICYDKLAKLAVKRLRADIDGTEFDQNHIEKLTTPKLIVRNSSGN